MRLIPQYWGKHESMLCFILLLGKANVELFKKRRFGIIDKFFGKKKSDSKDKVPKHAVIIHFLYGMDGLEPLHRLEKEINILIDPEGVGEYDGHEIALDYSDGFLYMYGPNAEALFKTVRPLLEQIEFMKGATAKIRFGPPENGVKEIIVKIK